MTAGVLTSVAQVARPVEAMVASVGDVRHYRIGVVPLSLRCECPRIAGDFHRLYSPYEVSWPDRASFQVEVRIRRSRLLRRYYHVLVNGHPQCVLRQASSVLPHLEWALNVAVARYLPDYYQVHAAVVCRGGAGVILPGSPGSGKSTLAAGLLARGWKYLSDEFALIEPESRLLMPYPKAICVKAGSFNVLGELGLPLDLDRILHKGAKGPVSLLDPLAVRGDAVAACSRPRFIVFPRYVPGASPSIEPMRPARAAFELIQVSFNFAKFRRAGFALVAALCRRADCLSLTCGDLGATCVLLEACVTRLGQTDAERRSA